MRKRLSGTGSIVLIGVVVCLICVAPGHASFGRTEGGYGGGMLGLLGGSTLGSAVVSAAGISNPALAGGIVATTAIGTGYLGSRAGSYIGREYVDERFPKEKVWGLVGAVTGGLVGMALGPGGTILGKMLGGLVGSLVGGWIGRKVASHADEDFNPRTVGALIGGINGAALGGGVGAAVGVTGGYLTGMALDRYIFVRPSDREREARRCRHRSGRGDTRDGRCCYYDPDIYNQYWQAYTGYTGTYPQFDERHWDYMAPAYREDMRTRYAALHRRRMMDVVRGRTDESGLSDDVKRLRDEYRRALDEVKRLSSSSADVSLKREALLRLRDIERRLNEAIRAASSGM